MADQYHKQEFLQMNLDGTVRVLKKGQYRILTNGIPVMSRVASIGSDGEISNIAGNQQQAYSLPAGTNRVIGFLEDRVGNRAFYFVSNTTPANDSIYQFVLGSGITLVMRDALLGLSGNTFVSADIVGDLLTFTTGVGEPKQINVADAIAGGIYTPTLEQITLIKRAPQSPLTLNPTGASRTLNNIRYNTFQFFHRFVYRDNAYSAFSPVSEALQPTGSTMDSIQVFTPTANIPAIATKIEYAFKKNGTNELTIYRSDNLPLTSSGHAFYNDTNLETVPDAEAAKWHDSVSKITKALKFHENRLFLFGPTEGYTLTGSPLTDATAGTTNGTGQILKDDSVYGVGLQYYDQHGRIIGLRKITDVTTPIRDIGATGPDSKKITVDLSMVATANIPEEAHHYSVLRTKNKRVSWFLSGVTADVWTRKELSDGTYSWAHAGSFSSISYQTELLIDISNLTMLGMGYTFNQGDRLKLWDRNSTNVFDLPIIGQEGKWVIARSEDDDISIGLPVRGIVTVFEIYTPKTNDFELYYEVGHREAINAPGTGSRAFSSTTVIIPGDVFIAPRTREETHNGVYRSYASTGFSGSNPDVSVENTVNATGSTFPSQFYSFAQEAKKNPNWSMWADGTGRGVSYDADGALQIAKKSVRFSNEYIQNSRVLGINTFEALNEQFLPVDNGTPIAMASAGDVLISLFDIESVALYIGEGFISTAEGNNFLAKSDQVVGDDRRYSGSLGTSHPATVVSRDGKVYWLDFKKQVVVRRSQDGLTMISDYGIRSLIGTLCETYRGLTASNLRITAGWDPQYGCYTLCFNDIVEQGISRSMTLMFHEATNSWVCRTDLRPEFFGITLNRQLHFLDGALWIQTIETAYNNFFGVQYNRTLAWEIAPQGSLEKIWTAIEVDIEEIFDTAGTNEDIVLLYQYNGGTLETRINYLDFNQRGSAWWSSFFRSLNDINFLTTTESKYKSRHQVRGQSAYLTIAYNGTDRGGMKSISVYYRPSLKTFP